MTCQYCEGKGYYVIYTWGSPKKEDCKFCNGKGYTKDDNQK